MGRALDLLLGRTTEQRAWVDGASWGSASWVPGSSWGSVHLPEGASEWSASATAYRCVQALADNASSVDLTVLVGDEARDDHPVAQLWNRGTTDDPVSARVRRHVAWQQLELTGEAMLYVDRGLTGEGDPRGMHPIYWPTKAVVADVRTPSSDFLVRRVVGWVVEAPRVGRIALLPGEVLWLRYPHPFDPFGALAPWKAALHAADADAWARAWQTGELRNGGRPSHLVYLGAMSESDHAQAVAEWRTRVEGPANAGKSLLVSGPPEGRPAVAQRLTMTPEEMGYLQSRTHNAAEVMLAFGVPHDYLAGGTTYENRSAARSTLWSDRIVPALDVVGSELDRQLLPDLREQAAWDLTPVDALQEAADAKAGRVRALVYADVVLLDEARADVGLEPLPNGQGQQTLTAYRRMLPSLEGGSGGGSAPAQLLGPRPRQLRVATAGRTQLVRWAPPQAAAPAGSPGGRSETLGTRVGLPRKRVEAFYDRMEAASQRATRKLAKRQQQVVLRELRKLLRGGRSTWNAPDAVLERDAHSQLPLAPAELRVTPDDVFDSAYWRDQTRTAYDAWLTAVYEGGGGQVADLLGVDFDLFDRRVLLAMETRADDLAHRVTETTRRALDAQLLLAGVEGGESVDQLADRLRAVFTELSEHRARTIARTETVGGFNASSHLVALGSGLVTSRVWLATKDTRTRDTHAELDGEVARGDVPYSNGLRYPGDTAGPPSQTVNCRCVETYDLGD